VCLCVRCVGGPVNNQAMRAWLRALPSARRAPDRACARWSRRAATDASASLADRLLAGDRAALARAISLVESTAPRHRPAVDALLAAALPRRVALADEARGEASDAERRASAPPSLRIGISGPPGAGKSTLIEALGAEMVARGHRLAVLAVDPSSHLSGGSVLGDKTRMPKLSADRRAYVRPSPARGALGGVARATQDAITLCECAGYDRIIVETVSGLNRPECSPVAA
jgi:LAO/AO transport system kinase